MYFGTSSQKKAMQDAFLVLILLVLSLFSDVWVDIPRWGMVVLLWICRITAACSVSFIILWMSGRTKTLIERRVSHRLIVIVFDKYEIAPGFMGTPEVVIEREVFNDMLTEK